MRKNNGITLVALIITIVILLILAGIAISQITGENGIFNFAKRARNNTLEAQEAENIILSDYENKINEIVNTYKKEELVNVNVLEDINKFSEVIENKEKLSYILENSNVFMEPILSDLELSKLLFENEEAMNAIIENDTWREEILNSNNDKSGQNSIIISALDNSNPVTLPTTNLTLYDTTTKTGNVLYSTYLRNSSIHSPINAFIGGTAGTNDWESDGLPAYIGYDYGEGNEVWIYKAYVKGGNNTTPTKMYLQSSDDNENWTSIYEFTRYTTANDYVTEIIDSDINNKKSRYWRLYITESEDNSYVDLLKIEFYGK